MRFRITGKSLLLTAFLISSSVFTLPASHAANLAQGKPTFADINAANAVNVTDNVFNNQWDTAGSPAAPSDFVGVDLEAPSSIKYVRVYWPANMAPTGFTIDVATNVTTDPSDPNYGFGDWVPVYTRFAPVCEGTTAPPQPQSPEIIDLTGTPLNYRYIRINGTDGPNQCASPAVVNWGVTELQVLDAPLPTVSGIVSANSTPVANAVVQLYGPAPTAGGPPTTTRSAKTTATGAYSFGALDAGAYTLTAFAPGQYAPAVSTLTVGASNITQNVSLTVPVVSYTAPLPAYTTDYISGPSNPKDANAVSASRALPADELPAGDAVWDTATGLPVGGTMGATMPTTLDFFFPPTADGKNNVQTAQSITIPFAPAKYTAIYLLQVAGDQEYSTSATLEYADGSSSPVTTASGNTVYTIRTGDATPGEDEIVAFTVDKLYNTADGATVTGNYSVFMRTIMVDSTKDLKALTFGTGAASNGTLAKGFLLAYTADSLAAAAPTGSISGTVTAPDNSPVRSAQVVIPALGGYRIVTDASGSFTFRGLPAGTYTVGASKAANYALKTIDVTLTAGQNATGQVIHFTAPIPVVSDALSNPSLDMVSSDTNLQDATISDFALGREFIPTGFYSPATVGSDPNGKWLFDPNAPSALGFQFGDIQDTPVLPGDPAYPAGGTPNSVVPHGATFLAPPAKIFNAYFAVVGFEGQGQFEATLNYADGTSQKRVVTISDWFGSPSPDELPYLIMRGRHFTGNGPGEANAGGSIRINALVVPVDATKQLSNITFAMGSSPRVYPCILAVSWETDVQQPESSDLKVHVTTSGGSPAVGAIVKAGPYDTLTNASGDAIFKGIPAGLTIGIGAYISGQTKQARVEGHVIPAGKKLPADPDTVNITLPSTAPIFVQLPLAYNYDIFAAPDRPGDYKGAPGNDWAFPSEMLPAAGTSTTVNGVPYLIPNGATGYNNVLRQNGQTISVAPGHYSSLDMVMQAMGPGSSFTLLYYVTFNYQDGSKEQVQFGVSDWFGDWPNPGASNRRLFYRQINLGAANPFYTTFRRNVGSSDQTGVNIAFLPEPIPVNAGKVLTSFTFVPIMRGFGDDDCSILAATLEANDTTATGTLTGRVIGQPLTVNGGVIGPEATPRAIEGAMVQIDAGHAAYTDANGNFSLPNVPLGAASLQIIPFGTGILSKTVPVTVASGTNALGDLNAGAGVTRVYAILGATNTEVGLDQREGYPIPYARDSGRPATKYTITDSATQPVTLGGKTAREAVYNSNYFYFAIDKGWLYRGKIGSVGMDPSTWVLNGTAFNGRVAPDIYMQIEYFDRGTDTLGVNYNMNEGWVHDGDQVLTHRMTNAYRTIQRYNDPADQTKGTTDWFIQKADTNTWKTHVYEMKGTWTVPVGSFSPGEPLGAYQSQNLESDFRITPRNNSGNPKEAIRSVVLSLVSPVAPLPGGAKDALRFIGGLGKPTASDISSLDKDQDGKVTFIDAINLAKAGNL